MILYALCNLMKSYMIDVLSKVRSAHSPEFTYAKPYQVVFCNSTIKISRDNSQSAKRNTPPPLTLQRHEFPHLFHNLGEW